MTAVTAKVQLSQKNQFVANTALVFTPDYADPANKAWAEATPALSFTMTVIPSVGDLFTPGGKYTVTFEPTVAAA